MIPRLLFRCLAFGVLLMASAQILHAQDPTIVTCGGDPVDETYCYVNSDSHTWHWQSSTGGPLILIFSAGAIESASFDHLRIYDGPDNTTAPVFNHLITTQELLAGVQVIGASGDIFMEMSSDVSVSCSSGSEAEWVWQVGCLDCTPPTATYTVVNDCDNFQFSVDVDITELGSDPDLDITNNGGAPTVTATAAGVYTVGPFTANIPVMLTLTNSDNGLCSVNSPGLVNALCATPVICGDPPLDETYCYVNSDNHTWHWQSSTGDPLILIFSAGAIESASFDHLRIYDGPDNTTTPVFNHIITTQELLAGVQVIGTSGDIYMEMTSDGSVSCSTGSEAEWIWQVGCLDCIPPEANFTVNTDCDAQTFTIDVDVTILGSDSTLDITNDGGAAIVTATDTGVVTVGPFPITTEVTLTLVNDSNSLCNLVSDILTNPLCPTHITCGEPALELSYCYANSDFHNWHWQNTDPDGTLALYFTSGTIAAFGAFGDNLVIYDGVDNTGTVIYQNPNVQTNLADTLIQTLGPDMYMEMSTLNSTFSSCADGNQSLWNWIVGCHDCAPATATYQVVTDCTAETFDVEVHLTDLGSQATVQLTNSVDATIVTASDTGLYVVGPFPLLTQVSVTVQNDTNSLCSVHSPVLTNPLCPTIVECGGDPLDETYCYLNSDNHTWHWQSSTGGPIILIFSAGQIESASFDHLRIYDGPDNTSTPVFNHTITTQELLAGVQVTGTNGDIYMEMTSDGSVSCSSGSEAEWVWQVGCLDCIPPQATFTVNTDCDAQNFTIDVNVNVLGSDSTLDITNDAGAAVVTATDTGVVTVGPFPITTEVTLTLVNDSNSLCNLVSDMLTNPLCPTHITCGEPALEQSYCYANSDFHAWHWQNTDPDGTLALYFSSGSIAFPGAFGDNLTIYDGPDFNAPVLYQNLAQVDLADLLIESSGPDLYMELNSLNSTFSSCADGNQSLWNWIVGCMDCTAPTATYTVVTDCDNFQYSVDVNISAMGSDPVIDITNNNGVAPVPASAAGTYTVGPFTAGTPTTVTLVNDMNSLCNVHSTVLMNPLCPTILECGADPMTETYCYTNNDNHTWHWQCACGSPLSFEFSAGAIESASFDHLRIFDGPDNSSPLMFDHVGAAEDLTGMLFISTGSDIYMEMTSDGSVSCSSGSEAEWVWTVGCLDCTNPEATFSVVPDCQHATYQIAVNVANTGSSSTVRIANTASADTLENVMAGVTLVGPIPMDSASSLTVMNATNGLCRVFSPEQNSAFADCVIPLCDAQSFTYCYTNSDTSYFAYQSTSSLPIAITFQAGQLLVSDNIQIYDSAGVSDNVLLFQGNFNGNAAGHSFNSSNPQNALVLRVVSDGSFSCQSGDATVPLDWTIECGYAGIHEETVGSFTMYPNPATQELYLRLPSNTHGNTEIRILDVSGRVVYTDQFTTAGAELNIFDLHGLQSGNYSVVVTTPDWVKAQNLQIIH